VKPDVVNVNTQQRVITKSDAASFPDGTLILAINGNGVPRFSLVNNASATRAISPTAISANQYVHLSGRYDFQSGDISIFINGQPVATASGGQAPSLSSQPWRIGEDNPVGGADEFINGTVDDTRIYTTALSDSQINQIYLNTEP